MENLTLKTQSDVKLDSKSKYPIQVSITIETTSIYLGLAEADAIAFAASLSKPFRVLDTRRELSSLVVNIGPTEQRCSYKIIWLTPYYVTIRNNNVHDIDFIINVKQAHYLSQQINEVLSKTDTLIVTKAFHDEPMLSAKEMTEISDNSKVKMTDGFRITMDYVMKRVKENANLGGYALIDPFKGCKPFPSDLLQTAVISDLTYNGYVYEYHNCCEHNIYRLIWNKK